MGERMSYRRGYLRSGRQARAEKVFRSPEGICVLPWMAMRTAARFQQWNEMTYTDYFLEKRM